MTSPAWKTWSPSLRSDSPRPSLPSCRAGFFDRPNGSCSSKKCDRYLTWRYGPERLVGGSVWPHALFELQVLTYLGKNVFVTMLDDYFGCKIAKEDEVVARTTMFSSDYPHSTTLWPRSQEYIAKLTEGMTDQVKYDIIAGNAILAYALD
jgi:hypothetical protein